MSTNPIEQSMKKLPTVVLMCLVACNSNSVSESDLEGKSFTAKMQMDTAMIKNPFAAGIMAMAKMEYRFQDDNKGIYHAEMGSMTHDAPIKWSVEGDSLRIEQDTTKRSYLIQKAENGFTIVDKATKVELTAK